MAVLSSAACATPNGVVQPCGHPSKFAHAHMYQPYVTSSGFAGKRPASIALMAPKPTYNTFSGEVVFVGRGCPQGSIDGTNPADPYLAAASGKIALIERGACTFSNKIAQAQVNGAIGAIVFNNVRTAPDSSEALIIMGGLSTVTVPPGTTPTTIAIPATFVQRSTGLLLENGTAPVTAFVQQ